MLTSKINFKNFKIEKLNKIKNFKNEIWFKKIKFLDSLKPNYKYSYTKNQIRKFKKPKNNGGSPRGVRAPPILATNNIKNIIRRIRNVFFFM